MLIPISSRRVLSFGLGATREGGAKLGDPGSAATWEPMMASGEKGKMMVNRSTSGWTNFWVPYFRPKKLTPRNDITMLIMFLGMG